MVGVCFVDSVLSRKDNIRFGIELSSSENVTQHETLALSWLTNSFFDYLIIVWSFVIVTRNPSQRNKGFFVNAWVNS